MPIKRKRGVAQPKHRHHFLAAWIRSPLKIGALLPSSRSLARAMAAEVNIEKPGAIIELGAGTGAVTQALLHAGIAPDRLVVMERDKRLHALMSVQFPRLNVVCADAAEMDKVLTDLGISRINAIVSSLPLLSMPKRVRQAIEHHMLTLIGEEGILIQFTYGPKSPISRTQLRQYRRHGKRKKLVVANLPPAHVWVYKKAS